MSDTNKLELYLRRMATALEEIVAEVEMLRMEVKGAVDKDDTKMSAFVDDQAFMNSKAVKEDGDE